MIITETAGQGVRSVLSCCLRCPYNLHVLEISRYETINNEPPLWDHAHIFECHKELPSCQSIMPHPTNHSHSTDFQRSIVKLSYNLGHEHLCLQLRSCITHCIIIDPTAFLSKTHPQALGLASHTCTHSELCAGDFNCLSLFLFITVTLQFFMPVPNLLPNITVVKLT